MKPQSASAELKRLARELDALLMDEDLDDDKLRDASEALLPQLADRLREEIHPYRRTNSQKKGGRGKSPVAQAFNL